MAVVEFSSAALPQPELQFRNAGRVKKGMGLVNEGFHLSRAHQNLFLRSTSKERESAERYVTSYGAHFQLQELLVPFEKALLYPQPEPVRIRFDNPQTVEKVLYYTENGKQLPRDVRYQAALRGVESGKQVFLQNLSHRELSLHTWNRTAMQHITGEKNDPGVDYSVQAETKLEGVVFEYFYPAGETEPTRTLIIHPL